jgi:hypothetical protein
MARSCGREPIERETAVRAGVCLVLPIPRGRSERKLEARLLDHSTVVAIQGGWVQLVHLGNNAAYVVARIFLAQPLGHASGEF